MKIIPKLFKNWECDNNDNKLIFIKFKYFFGYIFAIPINNFRYTKVYLNS